MIFPAIQIHEQSYEQNLNLVQVFIDLTNAFHTVDIILLWKIIKQLRFPDHSVLLIKYFQILHGRVEV